MREDARDIVDELWEDLDRRGIIVDLHPDEQLEILVAWYGTVEGILDGYDAILIDIE